MHGQRSISQVQAHVERCSSIVVFFSAVLDRAFSVVLSGLELLFSSIPPPSPPLLILFPPPSSTDLISVDGCLEWGLMAGLRGFASHGGCILSGGWLDTVEAPGYSRHPPSILSEAAVNRQWYYSGLKDKV